MEWKTNYNNTNNYKENENNLEEDENSLNNNNSQNNNINSNIQNNNNIGKNNDSSMFDMVFLPQYHSPSANMIRLVNREWQNNKTLWK